VNGSQEDTYKNEPRSLGGIRFHLIAPGTTDAQVPANQADPIPIPQAFEKLSAPIRFTDRGRAYLMTLPADGANQIAQELNVAIDRGLPVIGVDFDIEFDWEEDWDELAARIDVATPAKNALGEWEKMERRLYRARARLNPEDRKRMEEGFALYLVWPIEQEDR